MRAILPLAALALGLAGCTDPDDSPAAQATTWALTAAAPVGPPVDCIDRARIRGHAVLDAQTIDFTLDNGVLLRNRLPFACPGLTRTMRFTYKTALPRLCSTDRITMIQPTGATAGNCGLGAFQPVAIPRRQGALPRR